MPELPFAQGSHTCRCGHPISPTGDGLELEDFEYCVCTCHFEEPRNTIADTYVTAAVDAMVTATPDHTPRREAHIEQAITKALEVETDPAWRARLISTERVDARRAALQAWNLARRPLP